MNISANIYGEGVYFAAEAIVAAKYSTPDMNGTRYMFYCSILVGDFTNGTKGIVSPPVKNVETQEWYDSVCDNVSSPSTFVIFNDVQAYPEYLIIFRQKSTVPWNFIDLMAQRSQPSELSVKPFPTSQPPEVLLTPLSQPSARRKARTNHNRRLEEPEYTQYYYHKNESPDHDVITNEENGKVIFKH